MQCNIHFGYLPTGNLVNITACNLMCNYLYQFGKRLFTAAILTKITNSSDQLRLKKVQMLLECLLAHWNSHTKWSLILMNCINCT